jgi:hypothetical protein
MQGHYFYIGVDLVLCKCVGGLVSEDSDRFKDSMAMSSALGRCTEVSPLTYSSDSLKIKPGS